MNDFPAVSTPTRVGPSSEYAASPIMQRANQSFELLPCVANVPNWIPRPKDPRFKEDDSNSYKFVDDGVNTSIVNMCRAKLLVEDGLFFKDVVDLRTQNLLQHISDRARAR